MDIEIRRNGGMMFTGELSDGRMAKDILYVAPSFSEMEHKMFDECVRIRREIEEKIWSYFDDNEVFDLLGDRITRETHEIGYDVEFERRGEMLWAIARTTYVRPKISKEEVALKKKAVYDGLTRALEKAEKKLDEWLISHVTRKTDEQ